MTELIIEKFKNVIGDLFGNGLFLALIFCALFIIFVAVFLPALILIPIVIIGTCGIIAIIFTVAMGG